VAKLFDVQPERIMAGRIPEMTKALRGADFYAGLVDPTRVGPEAVRKIARPERFMTKPELRRFLKGKPVEGAARLEGALEMAREITEGMKMPKGWKSFDDVIGRIDELTAAAGGTRPKGWQQFDSIKALKGHAFAPDVAEEIARTASRMTNDQATNQMLRYYDKTLSFWKKWVLVAPAYVVRNMIGNFANNFYADIHLNAYRKALAAQAGKGLKVGGVTYSAKQFQQLARQWDIWKGGLYADVFNEHMQRLMQRGKGRLGKAMDALPNWTFQGNNYVETNARLAHFISKLDDGLSPGEAARSVTKYLFDYGEATKFEETVGKRVIMFYSWLRNNTALQMGQLFHEPWKVLAPVRVAGELTKGAPDVPPDLAAIQPEWTRRMLNAYIGRDERTGDVKILTQFGLPMEDVLRLDWHELAGQTSPIFRIPVELLTGRRIGFGRGESIEEYDRAYSVLRFLPESIKDFIEFEEITWPNGQRAFRMNPWKLYMLTNNPFSRLYTQLGRMFDERKGTAEKIMATMSGVKIASFHEESARLRAARERLQEYLSHPSRRGRVGIFKRFYARPGKELPPAEAEALKEQGRLRKRAKEVYARRDAAKAKAQE
jgi:hypothetical protein